jgi:transposase
MRSIFVRVELMGWTPPRFCGINVPAGFHMVWRTATNPKESDMNATSRIANVQSTSGVIVGVDIAESVFQLCEADTKWRRRGQHRLSRTQFERWFDNRDIALVVMEACGTAHYWARWLINLGIEVVLLPPMYVRAYVKRNKTDAADAAALLEAARCADIDPVRVKTVEQQALQALHRTRSMWMGWRTATINALRGACREFGLRVPKGASVGLKQMAKVIADDQSAIPTLLRSTMNSMLEEVRQLEVRIVGVEKELTRLVQHSQPCKLLMSVPGVGLLTTTALAAATGGDVTHFKAKGSRGFACWFGITPRENSSGNKRRLGRISKQGDAYLRTLLVHGARSVLTAAATAQAAGKPLDALKRWALQVQARVGHNKAACALANKLARICYACLRDGVPYQAKMA